MGKLVIFALVSYLVLGIGLGLLTCLPLGVANIAVVDAALRTGRRRALGIAFGGALADTMHAGAALAGIGPALNHHPAAPGILFVVSGVLIVAYGLHSMRTPQSPRSRGGRRGARGGFAVGLMLTLLNPAALLAWIVLAGAVSPGSIALSATTALGVGAGAFAGLATLAHLASRGQDVLASQTSRFARWVGVALLGLGVLSLARGAYVLLG